MVPTSRHLASSAARGTGAYDTIASRGGAHHGITAPSDTESRRTVATNPSRSSAIHTMTQRPCSPRWKRSRRKVCASTTTRASIPGRAWDDELAEAILRSAVFVFFVSAHSVASPNCRREIALAVDNDKPVIAVYLEDVELPPGLRLSIGTRQAIVRARFDEARYRERLVAAIQRTRRPKHGERDTEERSDERAQRQCSAASGRSRRYWIFAAFGIVVAAGASRGRRGVAKCRSDTHRARRTTCENRAARRTGSIWRGVRARTSVDGSVGDDLDPAIAGAVEANRAAGDSAREPRRAPPCRTRHMTMRIRRLDRCGADTDRATARSAEGCGAHPSGEAGISDG